MTQSPTHEANSPASLGKQLAIELLIILTIGTALGLLGPFGSYDLPLGWRLGYWVGFGLIGYLIFRPLSVAAHWLSATTAIPLWLAITLSAMVAGIPMAWIIGFAIGGMEYRAEIVEDGFALLYAQTTGIGLGIYLLSNAIFTDRGDPPEHARAERFEDQSNDQLQDRGITGSVLHGTLPTGFPAIVALSVEDHYVKVHAANRSEMLLMNLSEAIAMLPPDDGIKVHRSWWVARAAVVKAKRSGRNYNVELAGGLIAPVSRANVALIRQAGWLNI